MIRIEVDRVTNEFGFEAKDGHGHTVSIDTSLDTGGKNFGVRPMQLLLMGLGGCSGIDIVSILNKQRQKVDNFHMKIDGKREEGKDPSLWKTIDIIFEFTGKIDHDKAVRACQLSIEKYCSVAETLRRSGTEIKWKVRVNGQ